MNKVYPYLIGLLLVSLPFERLLTVELSGYTLKFSYLFGILLIAYFFCDLIRRKVKDNVAAEEVLLVFFSVMAFLTLFWTLDFKRSLVISLMFLFMALIFIVLRRLIDDKRSIALENLLIWLGLAAAIFGLWQFFAGSFDSISHLAFLRPQYTKELFGFPRIQSTFLEPLYFADFLLISIGLLIKRVCLGVHDYLKLFIIGIAFFLTLSRGGIYALAGGLVLALLVILVKFRKYLAKYLLSILVIVAAALVSLALIYVVSGHRGVGNYFSQAQNTSLSSDEVDNNRLSTTQVAWRTFKNHPFGIGAGAFGALPEYKSNIPARGYQTVNNLYLEVLVEEGIIGLVFLAGFVVLLIIDLIKRIGLGKIENLFYLAILVSFLIQFLTFSTLYIMYIWVFLALAWSAAPPRKSKDN